MNRLSDLERRCFGKHLKSAQSIPEAVSPTGYHNK